jgi:DNA-binding MarR family transcriptional regulator
MLAENAILAIGISRADAALRKQLEGPLGGAHGIGFTDFQILAELSAVQGGRLRATDLAKRLMLTPSGVTRAVIPLEKVGLVQRQANERDARGTFIALTPTGSRRAAEAAETVERVVGETLAATITRTDRLALLGLFERLGY